jgi:penicillin-binding protein 2
VLAMASNPPYQPSIFVQRNRRKLNDVKRPERNFPLLNRATSGRYPPGSTFKPVTAIAAMEQRLIAPYDSLPCTGSYTAFKQKFANWNPYFDEPMTLPTALATSCDTYFYILGEMFYRRPAAEGHPFQDWAARLGFGQRTGFDVGFEDAGLLPTPEWRERTFKTELDRDWKPGHSIQLAIGQTDLLVTPLQMTRFYALLANGGQLVTPHVVAQAEQPTHGGTPVVRQVFAPPPSKPSGVDAEALEVIHQGLLAATQSSYGTSYGVFGHFPYDIAGKTGTAEKFVDGIWRDQSWWCGYGPAASPELVVCALIENGGHGSDAAAPAARRVFEAYWGIDEGTPLLDTDSD